MRPRLVLRRGRPVHTHDFERRVRREEELALLRTVRLLDKVHVVAAALFVQLDPPYHVRVDKAVEFNLRPTGSRMQSINRVKRPNERRTLSMNVFVTSFWYEVARNPATRYFVPREKKARISGVSWKPPPRQVVSGSDDMWSGPPFASGPSGHGLLPCLARVTTLRLMACAYTATWVATSPSSSLS